MLKDYFDSSLSPYSQDRIQKVLNTVYSWCIFSSYGQARAYRAANFAKDENGRYDYSILLYNGFYYVISRKCRQLILNHIAEVRRDDNKEKQIAEQMEYCLNNLHPYSINRPADRLIDTDTMSY